MAVAIAVFLSVGLVVLLVVGDEIVRVKPSCAAMKLILAYGRFPS